MCKPKPPAINHDLGKKMNDYAESRERELNEARQRYVNAFEHYMESKRNSIREGGENA